MSLIFNFHVSFFSSFVSWCFTRFSRFVVGEIKLTHLFTTFRSFSDAGLAPEDKYFVGSDCLVFHSLYVSEF